MFDFLNRFRPAEHVGVFEKNPGINIDGAFVGDALVNVLFGEKVPQITYTIGVGGRGSLVVAEQEFRDLLMSMVKMAEVRSPGYMDKLIAAQVVSEPTPEEQVMKAPDPAVE
jgi:hypothetical protein